MNECVKKYELTEEFKMFAGRKLFRIKALIDFSDIEKGDLGGWIESENNLSHNGDAWVYDNAQVYGDALVCDDARVCDNAQIYGNAWVYDNPQIYGNARVCDDARVCGNARIYDNARVCGNAWVYDDAQIYGNAWVYDDAQICDNAWVYDNAQIYSNARVCGNAWVCDDARVCDDFDYTIIKGFGTVNRTTTFFRCNNGIIKVSCGCFVGTIEEFRKQVKKTRSGKIAKEYLMIADLMEYHFGEKKYRFPYVLFR